MVVIAITVSMAGWPQASRRRPPLQRRLTLRRRPALGEVDAPAEAGASAEVDAPAEEPLRKLRGNRCGGNFISEIKLQWFSKWVSTHV